MMPNLEIDRCMVTIEATPPLHHYVCVARGATTFYNLPFRSPAERTHFLHLLAAYVGPAVAPSDIDDLAALLCLYRSDDEAAAHAAAHYLNVDYSDLLMVTPLEEVAEMVGLLLDEAAAAEDARR